MNSRAVTHFISGHLTLTEAEFKTDEARDQQMTSDSDCDIAWVRLGRETSGTQKNIDRRNQYIEFP